jgi:hypothetical protein
MRNLLKSAVDALLVGVLKAVQGRVVRSLKLEALKLYLKLVAAARQVSLLALAAVGVLLLGAIGFVMVHVGVLLLLPVTPETKGWIVLGLGIVYTLVAACFLRAAFSEKAWLEASKASAMLSDLLRK